MNKRRLGQTDIEISPVGLGCWQFSQGKGLTGGMWAILTQETIDAVVEAAITGGINWFDTAEAYGGGQSERTLSTAFQHLRIAPGDVQVATKWLPLFRTAANIPRTIDTRLRCLQGYPIDLYQIHLPWSFSSIPRQMQEMAKLLRSGKIRSIGVSNFSARQMEMAYDALRAEGMVLASNQVAINLLNRHVEHDGLLAAAQKLGVTLIAYSPLAQGLLSGKYHQHPDLLGTLPTSRRSPFNPASRTFSAKNLARTLPLIEELRTISAAYGISVAQVALAWLITYYKDTVVAIPGASRPEQATESAAAMSIKLTKHELAKIGEISQQIA